MPLSFTFALDFFCEIFFLCPPPRSGVTVDSYSCLDPGIPVNGIRYGQDFSIGSTVSFGCDSGYRLSHEEPLVCEKNHWWSHPLPTCDGKYSLVCRVSVLMYFLASSLLFARKQTNK